MRYRREQAREAWIDMDALGAFQFGFHQPAESGGMALVHVGTFDNAHLCLLSTQPVKSLTAGDSVVCTVAHIAAEALPGLLMRFSLISDNRDHLPSSVASRLISDVDRLIAHMNVRFLCS